MGRVQLGKECTRLAGYAVAGALCLAQKKAAVGCGEGVVVLDQVTAFLQPLLHAGHHRGPCAVAGGLVCRGRLHLALPGQPTRRIQRNGLVVWPTALTAPRRVDDPRRGDRALGCDHEMKIAFITIKVNAKNAISLCVGD